MQISGSFRVWFFSLFFFTLVNLARWDAQTVTLDSFSWSGVPATIPSGQPFPVTIQAKDAAGIPVTNFNGVISIKGLSPDKPLSIFITKVETLLNKRIELGNLSSNAMDVSNWRVCFYDSQTWPVPKAFFAFPQGISIPAFGVVEIRGMGSASGGYIASAQLFWGNSPTYPHAAVSVLDAVGNPVDFFCAGDSYPGFITQPRVPGLDDWSGPPVAQNNNGALSYQRIGSFDHNNRADWVAVTNAFSVWNPSLQKPHSGPTTKLLVQPTSASLTNGSWTGSLTILEPATNLVLRADDLAGHAGDSPAFTVPGPPPLRLGLPLTLSEATPLSGNTGLVFIQFPLASNLTINLASSASNEVAVAASAIILAGATNVTFTLTNLDDALLDGPQVVEVMASAAGFGAIKGTITNLDNEFATLTVISPTNSFEGSGLLTSLAVRSSAAPATNFIVRLSSSDTNRILVPEAVLLLPGETNVNFAAMILNDGKLNESALVTLQASVPGWNNGVVTINVRDAATTNIVLILPFFLAEGMGTTNAGSLQISGTLATNLIIALTSSIPAKLQVPAQVVIPAGQTSVVFAVTVPEDTLADTDSLVQVTAIAGGFSRPARNVTVQDNALHHFVINPLPNSSMANAPLALKVTAVNASGSTLTAYSGGPRLTAAGTDGAIPIVPVSIGPFTNGTWEGTITLLASGLRVVLSVDDLQGHAGQSNPFDVSKGQALAFPLSDIAYDAVRNRVLAATKTGAGTNSQQLLAIEPQGGSVLGRLPLGNDPGKIAISDDSSQLYVSLQTTGGVLRVDNTTFSENQRFPLGAPGIKAEALTVQRGNPQGLVVSRWLDNVGSIDTAYFSGGIMATSTVPRVFQASSYSLVFHDSPSNFLSTFSNGLRWLNLATNGVRLGREVGGISYPGEMSYAAGLVYSTTGDVYDPENLRKLGTYSTNGLVAADPATGRVFFVSGTTLSTFDLSSFALVDRRELPITAGTAMRLLRCGPNTLALATSTMLLLIQTDWISPFPAADLSVTQTSSAGPAIVGSNFAYTITIANAGPAGATNASLVDVLPADSELVSATPSQGAWGVTNGLLTWSLGSLSAGGSATLSLVMTPQTPGSLVNRCWLTGDVVNLENGVSRHTNTCVFGTPLPAVTRLWLNALDLAYDSFRQRLWFGSERYTGAKDLSVRWLVLSNGLVGGSLPAGQRSRKIALTASGSYLYAGYTDDQDHSSDSPDDFLQRWNLSSNSKELDFPVLDQVGYRCDLTDMAAIPGLPNGLLVAQGANPHAMALYDGSSVIKRSPNETGDGRLEVNPAIPNRFYRLSRSTLGKFQINPGSIDLLNSSSVFSKGVTDMRLAGGLLYSDQGDVVGAETMVRLVHLPVVGPVLPDAAQAKVFYLVERDQAWALEAFSTVTYERLWSLPLPLLQGQPSNLTLCGSGLMAFATTEDQLFLINTLALPNFPLADLVVSASASGNPTVSNNPAVIQITVSNAGPSIATGILLTNNLPTNATLVSLSSSQGSATNDNGRLNCEIGSLAVGATATLTITLQPTIGGTLWSYSGAKATESDARPENSVAAAVIHVPESSTTDIYRLHVPTSDLAYDRLRDRIYLSIPPDAPVISNRVMALDPVAVKFRESLLVGNGLGKLAITDDAQFLYVGVSNNWLITRVALDTLQTNLSFSIGFDEYAMLLAAVPGQPYSVAVGRYWDPGWSLLGIYDEGVRRPNLGQGHSFTFNTNASLLCAAQNTGSGSVLSFYQVTAGGLGSVTSLRLLNPSAEIKRAGILLYCSSGEIVDPAIPSLVGLCSGSGFRLVEPDLEHGRINFLALDGTVWRLKSYDAVTYAPLGAIDFPDLVGTPSSLTHLKDGGLAFRTSGGQVFICRPPKLLAADLSIRLNGPDSPLRFGENLTYSLSITNRSPAPARDVIVTNTLPAHTTVVSATASVGTWAQINSDVVWNVGILTNGSTETLHVTLEPLEPGLFITQARVTSFDVDPDDRNNQQTILSIVTNDLAAPRFPQFSLPARDIVYDPIRSNLLLSISTGTNLIARLDPFTQTFLEFIPVTVPPDRLALSDNGQYLYYSILTGGIARVNLDSNMVDLHFSLGVANNSFPNVAADMDPIPGQPDSLAVSVQNYNSNVGVRIYDRGQARSNSVPPGAYGGAYPISFGSNGSVLYSTTVNTLRVISVDGTGARLDSEVPDLVPGYAVGFESDRQKLFFQSGRVVDPVSRSIVGTFPASGLVAPDTSNDRVYFLNGTGDHQFNWQLTLLAFNASSFSNLWSVPFPIASGMARRLTPLGGGAVACLTDAGNLFIVPPNGLPSPQVDLRLTTHVSPNPAPIGSPLTWSFNVQNLGPWNATKVQLNNRMPLTTRYLSAASTVGSVQYGIDMWGFAEWITADLGTLAVGSGATVTLITIPNAIGDYTSTATLSANERDPVMGYPVVTVVGTNAPGPVPTASVLDVGVREGNTVGAVTLQFLLSTSSSLPVSLRYQTRNGTALAGTDYNTNSGVVTINPGQKTASVTTSIIRGNTLVGSNRFFYVNIAAATNATLERTQAVVLIVEDDFRTVSGSNVTVVEGKSGTTNAAFKFTLSQASSDPVSFDYATTGTTALSGTDFSPKAGTLSFPPGTTNLILSVPIFGDTLPELDESFSLLLSQPSSAVLAANSFQGIIANDDVHPPLAITRVEWHDADLQIQFQTVAGRSYRLERSPTLLPGSWESLAAGIAGTGATTEVVDPGAVSRSASFYRLVQLP